MSVALGHITRATYSHGCNECSLIIDCNGVIVWTYRSCIQIFRKHSKQKCGFDLASSSTACCGHRGMSSSTTPYIFEARCPVLYQIPAFCMSCALAAFREHAPSLRTTKQQHISGLGIAIAVINIAASVLTACRSLSVYHVRKERAREVPRACDRGEWYTLCRSRGKMQDGMRCVVWNCNAIAGSTKAPPLLLQ